jgi:uncharacterized protein (DUF1697 family)
MPTAGRCTSDAAPVRTDVFLLRGIGPATHRIMTMKALEAACHGAGLPGTRSVIATGNILVPSSLPETEVEARIAACLAAGGLKVAWQRRTVRAIEATIAAARDLQVFAEALAVRPAKVQVHFVPDRVPEAALDRLRAWAPDARIATVGEEVLIDYAGPVSESALSLARIDRIMGAGATARNWNTVQRIVQTALKGGSVS